MPVGRVAARTVKRPESATIRGVFQPTAAGALLAAEQVIALCAAWHFTDRSIIMEDLGLRALYRRVAGIDVHRMLHVVTVLIEQADGSMQRQTREFGGFRRDCRALAAWLAELGVELVVLESTGIYWKSVHAHLENAGIAAWVVNAHMIKHVPGRKTDMADSEWLAVLARFGLVRASFIPPKDLRELRLVSRYRRKLGAMCASEINRLHKVLDDGGIKLGGVVSDINGVSARAMVSALIAGQPIEHMLGLAHGALKQKREDLGASLDGDLSARHLFVLGHIQAHIETLQRQIAQIDAYLLAAMQPYGLGARVAADHPRHRRAGRGHDPHRDRRRHGPLRLRRAPGQLGRAEPGQQRERGQAQVRAHPARQFDHPLHPVRVRQCRAHDQQHAGGQVPQPDGAQVAQEGHRGGGAQDDPADLPAAEPAPAVPRPEHRLRGHERQEERASLDQAAQDHRTLASDQARGCQHLIRR
jgi:transposase